MVRVIQSLTIPTVPGVSVWMDRQGKRHSRTVLGSNSTAHWATKRKETQRIYSIVRAEAMQQQWQQVGEPVIVEIEIVYPANRRASLPDEGNRQILGKALTDSLLPCKCRTCMLARSTTGFVARQTCREFYWWTGILVDDAPRYVKTVHVSVLKGEHGPQTTIRLLKVEESDGRET